MVVIAMGSYVNSHIVLIGSADAIHNAMGDVIAAKVQFNNVTYSNNDTRIDLCVETISEAPELFVKKLKNDNKLDAAFVKAIDYDGYEIAYFKEIDDDELHEYEEEFGEINYEFGEDEDALFDANDKMDDKVSADFEKYIKDYLKNK